MRDFQGAAGRKVCDNEGHFLCITGKVVLQYWCCGCAGPEPEQVLRLGKTSWPHSHFPLPTLHSTLSLQTWRSVVSFLSLLLSLNMCERALHLCAAAVHDCPSWMLGWGSLSWEHPTFGKCDVGKDQVPKCKDVYLDPSFPISHKVPVQGNGRVC